MSGSIKESIDHALSPHGEATISKTLKPSDEIVSLPKEYPLKQIHRRLLLWYGTDRVSKCSGGFKVLSK